MTLNPKLLEELRAKAIRLGVVLALPNSIHRITPESQNHIMNAASNELVWIEHEKTIGDE